ncbi:2-aminoethylphosphonate-pyruvate transaminase [Methylobacterium sp. ap11]|uniref:aminotransferase class V-fold PLP-dependent enzyme n=1 Tax=Methylobacterium sp. ap11 TaxID=1761799 RepID=UPI0008D7EC72|nr:aminotransferase class V-fold PLP-dependent enzyme [Methylobacterium sp. ap11]SEP49070.1 2-aminoethylphosphonate-pyruvate transaminase [Methylobacterium sp. ap11]
MTPSPSLLVTPGPVATSPAVRAAMTVDRSAAEPGMIAALRQMQTRIGALVRADAAYAVIPVPGSATQANEMVLRALPPPGATVLIVTNGAYGDWLASLCVAMGRGHRVLRSAPLGPIPPERVATVLEADTAISHVAFVHVETSSGLLNPLPEIAAICRRLGRGLIVDAVAAAGIVPLDVAHARPEAVVLSSNKGLQGPPGLAWVVTERAALERGRGFAASSSLDLFDQHQHVERTGTFRFTPPTQVLCGVAAALEELEAEGLSARSARYRENWVAAAAVLTAAGFPPLLRPPHAAPIVVTVALPEDGPSPAGVTDAMAHRGYVLVPGRLAVPRTVRLGCIGALTPADTARAAKALAEVLSAGPPTAAG